jgi:NAD(P)-dependent dehydrogenase (short-subunit alcohol dehydrogenase family)
MNREIFSAWANMLIRAWENHDAQAAATLFTDNATYQENPFDEPLRGRAAIQAYWSEMPRQQDDIHTDFEVLDFSETNGVARWSATYMRVPTGEHVQLEGVFIASFDSGGSQAHTFREWWHMREDRSDRRVALITGASRGLGTTLAGFLAGQGYDLILTARGSEALQAAADGLKPYHTAVIALAGDVADPAHRQRLFEAAQSFGRLDVLANNASDLGPSPLPTLADYPLPELERVFAVNVIAPVALTQLMLPLLKTHEGLVVNISSDAAVGGYENWGGYGASKAALDLISKTQAGELHEARVAVVSVDPGDMRTVMQQQAVPGEDISDRPEPDATLPFWAWLLAQDHMDISGARFQAQAEQWRVPG